ncbi:hypothetical protein ECG_09724 [Echinococcus granulosus]|uniref:DNA helicase n=1 Tax=Echinococcus granulosus TaxID=6210 RepID=A0A068WKW4_ECHGR|nr:hypothetical protein ECG_09724 [Echinococcus granulosus]CDS20420.1 hypothetical protein EgrG_001107600 [Echinococcus granulosus]
MLTLNSDVLALNRADGCMHMGRIADFLDDKNALIRFRSSAKTQEVPSHLCLPVKGFTINHSLELNDPVLCWVPGHVADTARNSMDRCQALNLNYSIQLFYGSCRLFRNRDTVKISPQLHDALVNYIINLNVDDRGNCKRATNAKPKPSRSTVTKRKKHSGKSVEMVRQPSVSSTQLKEKTTQFAKPLISPANHGDPIRGASHRRLSKLDFLSKISSPHFKKQRTTMETNKKDDSSRNRQKFGPFEKKGLGELVESPPPSPTDRVWTRATNSLTSSANPSADNADDFADGYEEFDEWDKTYTPTSSILGLTDPEKEAVAVQEDASVAVDLPKANCRLTVSASINRSEESSKTCADSKFVDVTLFPEGKSGSYQQTVNLTIPHGGRHGSGGSGVVKVVEVPFAEKHLINVEQFLIQESDERYVVTDDCEESRSGETTATVEAEPITPTRSTDQPVCLGASMDCIPGDERVLEMSSLRPSKASVIEGLSSLEPHPGVERLTVHVPERFSTPLCHEACQIESIPKFSASNFMLKCLTVERYLLAVVKGLASFSGERVVLKTLEAVECVNHLQLIFVEALELRSSVKASLNTHRGRELCLKKREKAEAGNNSSTPQNALAQKSRIRHRDEKKRLLGTELDHWTRQCLEKIPPQELADGVSKGKHSFEGDNDLEPCAPIIAQGVSELERRLHSAFLTPRRRRIRAFN